MLHRAKARSRRFAGFTMVELMIVMAIMVMMITVAIPAVDSFMKSQGPEAAARIVRGALFAAKMKAIRSREPISFDVRPVGSIASFTAGVSTGGIKQRVRPKEDITWIPDYFEGKYLFLRHSLTGNRIGRITGNTAGYVSVLNLSKVMTGTKVDIVEEKKVKQLCVTPDNSAEVWEMLPQWMEVTSFAGTNFWQSAIPLTFKPNGTPDLNAYYATIHISDMRVPDEDSERKAATTVQLKVMRNTGAIRRVEKDD